MFIPNNNPEYYERGHYLSRAVKEEARLLLQKYGEDHYRDAIEWLFELIEDWKLEVSQDGLIRKATMATESPDKIIKVDIKARNIQVSFNGIPIIRESRWDNLITECSKALTFPNKYLKVTPLLVTKVCETMQAPHLSIVYKALLEISDPVTVEESVYTILQSAATLMTEEELEQIPTIRFEDQFYYVKDNRKSVVVLSDSQSQDESEHQEDTEGHEQLTVKDEELLTKLLGN